MNCKGCGANLQTAFQFCPSCGEIAHPHRLDLRHILHEFIHAFLHADKGIFLLIKQLLYLPGQTALDYVNGSRKKYFNPVSFLLIAGGLSFFLRDKLEAGLPASSKKVAIYIAEFMHKFATPIIILTVPVLSLFSWLLFKSSGKNYAENLVMNMYMMGEYHLFAIFSFIIPVALFPQGATVFTGISFLVMGLYYYFTCRCFFGQGNSKTVVKVIAVEFLYVLTTAVFMGIALIVYFIHSGIHIKDLK